MENKELMKYLEELAMVSSVEGEEEYDVSNLYDDCGGSYDDAYYLGLEHNAIEIGTKIKNLLKKGLDATYINGDFCKGTSGSLWGNFGRGGCIEKLWQTSNGQYHIYETKEKAQEVLDKIREEEFDGESFGVVGGIGMVAVDPINYSKS